MTIWQVRFVAKEDPWCWLKNIWRKVTGGRPVLEIEIRGTQEQMVRSFRRAMEIIDECNRDGIVLETEWVT